MRRGLAAMLVWVAVQAAFLAAPAAAQCAPDASLENAVGRANTVFVGRVVRLSNNDRTAEVEVLAVWKGRDLPPVVVLLGGSDDPAELDENDRMYRVGVTYLVVSEDLRPPFEDDRCTATRAFGGSPSVIPGNLRDAVGAAVARSPVTESASDDDDEGGGAGQRLLIALVGSLAVIIAAVVLIRTASTYRPAPGTMPLGSDEGGDDDADGGRGVRDPVGPLFGRTADEEMARLRKEDRKRRRRKAADEQEAAAGDERGGEEEPLEVEASGDVEPVPADGDESPEN
jgi:hypothetical protein